MNFLVAKFKLSLPCFLYFYGLPVDDEESTSSTESSEGDTSDEDDDADQSHLSGSSAEDDTLMESSWI